MKKIKSLATGRLPGRGPAADRWSPARRNPFFLLLLLSPFFLCGNDLKTAEEFFMQGKWDDSRKILEKLLSEENLKNLSAADKTKAAAMQEYIIGNNPNLIAQQVKMAKEIAAHPNWLTADLLNHSTLLIRRAADWKDRGIIEYQELSAAAAKLLGQASDNGDPNTALKIILLQIRNHNLNGEYNEPLKQIIRTLQFYYPAEKNRSKKLPEGAVRLMILAGDQYMGLGLRANSERDKKDAFSQAAVFYVRSLNNLPSSDPQFQTLSDQIHYCAEALKLLGFQLKMPARINPRRNMDAAMIDEMLKQRRYQDVILATENQNTSVMQIRYAAALAGLGNSEKAVEIACNQELAANDAPLVLNIARTFLAGGKKKEALLLLQHYLKYQADHQDAGSAYSECAALLLDSGSYGEAADYFLKFSAQTKDPAKKERAILTAAQSYYNAKNFQQCLDLLQAQPFQPDNALLIAQSYISLNKHEDALKQLKDIMPKKILTDAQQKTTLQLAIACLNGKSPQEEIIYCNQILEKFPEDPDSFEYAKRLLKLLSKENEFQQLAVWALTNHLEHAETVALVIQSGEHIPDLTKRDKLYEKLLMRRSFEPADLAAILKYFNATELKLKFLERYRRPFVNTPDICELYYQIAILEAARDNHAEARKHCETLLNQKPIYEYFKVKMLYADTLTAAGNDDTARRQYQELLLTKLKPHEMQQTVLKLAQSYEKSGDHKKAIATAWTAIPLDGKADAETKPIIRTLLELIIQNAQKINSPIDQQDAQAILQSL